MVKAVPSEASHNRHGKTGPEHIGQQRNNAKDRRGCRKKYSQAGACRIDDCVILRFPAS